MAKSDMLHQCEMCDFSTNDSILWLKNHKKSSVTFHCEKCQYRSCTFQGLQIHDAKTHSKNEQAIDDGNVEVIDFTEEISEEKQETNDSNKILYNCEMCDFTTNDSDLWSKNHKKSTVTFQCEKCQFKSCTFRGLQFHDTETHSKETNENEEIIEILETKNKNNFREKDFTKKHDVAETQSNDEEENEIIQQMYEPEEQQNFTENDFTKKDKENKLKKPAEIKIIRKRQLSGTNTPVTVVTNVIMEPSGNFHSRPPRTTPVTVPNVTQKSREINIREKTCFVYPLIKKSVMSSKCGGKLISTLDLRRETKTKKAEICVILDRCGIFGEEEQKNNFFSKSADPQHICQFHRSLLFLKFKNNYNRPSRCMWKNHIQTYEKGGQLLHPTHERVVRGFSKNMDTSINFNKILLEKFDWLIPYDGIMCNSCFNKVKKLLKNSEISEKPEDVVTTIAHDMDYSNGEDLSLTVEVDGNSEKRNIEIVDEKILEPDTGNGVNVKCQYCYKKFSQKGINAHINLQHLGLKKMFKCEYCDRSYSSQLILDNHIESVHEENEEEENVLQAAKQEGFGPKFSF